jgi:formamidopyrimidine-DNA glycosylase
MPELPEVEHVVRGLRRAVLGRRILATELNLPRIVASPSPSYFKRKLRGVYIDAISRRGKYILFALDSGDVLVTHLRMTGKFVCITDDQPLPPYPHVVFYLDDERRLVFCDMRQFGRMRLLPAARLSALLQIRSLSPEPLNHDLNFS